MCSPWFRQPLSNIMITSSFLHSRTLNNIIHMRGLPRHSFLLGHADLSFNISWNIINTFVPHKISSKCMPPQRLSANPVVWHLSEATVHCYNQSDKRNRSWMSSDNGDWRFEEYCVLCSRQLKYTTHKNLMPSSFQFYYYNSIVCWHVSTRMSRIWPLSLAIKTSKLLVINKLCRILACYGWCVCVSLYHKSISHSLFC